MSGTPADNSAISIDGLINDPERTIRDIFKSIMGISAKGGGLSAVVTFVYWALTSEINYPEAIKTVIIATIFIICTGAYALFKYFHQRLTEEHEWLKAIATKHRDEVNAKVETQLRLEDEIARNQQLREDAAMILKELNHAIIEFSTLKQRDYQEERILRNINEAIENVGK